MNNLDKLKQKWTIEIESFNSDEVYELLTGDDSLFSEGICKFCRQIFDACEETLEDDSICRKRFETWCKMSIRE